MTCKVGLSYPDLAVIDPGSNLAWLVKGYEKVVS